MASDSISPHGAAKQGQCRLKPLFGQSLCLSSNSSINLYYQAVQNSKDEMNEEREREEKDGKGGLVSLDSSPLPLSSNDSALKHDAVIICSQRMAGGHWKWIPLNGAKCKRGAQTAPPDTMTP